ncbi:hypothetical protein FDP41_006038 [Naegleria fowleri]|uniref:Uncharacterized protein n=1 Tax=Naegleria fowleri TaxID=5763 RepID=A0A6A5B9Z6_NAEFO|nr:uncharacterized protein FDP41_006038 [Naegleria fowleri]KAF0974933.1 hypothetical protein FDP41_006038 [Naegleria fowleri]
MSKKSRELQIDRFDARRLEHRETKFQNEVSELFLVMCLQNELIETPSCLKKYEHANLSEKKFSATERKELFADLLKCASLNENSEKKRFYECHDSTILDRYVILSDYDSKIIYQKGSLKTMPSLYNAFTRQIPDLSDLLEGDNLNHLTENDISKLKIVFQKFKYEKQLDQIVKDYETLSNYPPLFLALTSTSCIPYCRKHLLNCLKKVYYQNHHEEKKEEGKVELDDAFILDLFFSRGCLWLFL